MPLRKKLPEPIQPAKRRRSAVRRWAHSALFVAALAVVKMSESRDDVEMTLFDEKLVARLRVTITRYHD